MLEEMTTEMWIGLIAFVVGLIFLGGAAFRKQVKWKMNPMFSLVIGVLLIVVGGIYGVLPMIPEEEPTEGATVIVTPPTTAVAPQFEVSVDGASPVYRSGQGGFADPTSTDTTLNALFLGNYITNTSFNDTATYSLNFSFSPIAGVSHDANSLATIYFTTDYGMKHRSEYILDSVSTGERSAQWTYGTTGTDGSVQKYYEGSRSVLMTSSGWANITYVLDTGTDSFASVLADDATIGEGSSWTIRFYNADNSWSKVYTVNWMWMGKD